MLGLLLVEGIQATKAYTNFPGYDLLAFNPERNLSCRIQVKSRWATDYDKAFPMKNFDCDFVVHAALNRGYRGYRRKPTNEDDGRRAPQMYVFPVRALQSVAKPSSTWGGKVFLRDIPNAEDYIDNWTQIRSFLQIA